MSDAARHCAFCGSRTELRREHVYPQWLSKLIFRNLEADPRFPANSSFRVHIYGENGERERVNRTTIDTVTRRVCKTCNNTWLSRLETRIEPIFAKLLGDRPITLSLEDQCVLSLWAAKTAMTNALARPEPHAYVPERHCRELMSRQEPPSRSEVWLAAHQGESFGCSTYLDKNEVATEAASGSLGPYVVYNITINVVGVVLQFVGNTLPGHWILEGVPEPGPTATRIWPPTDGPVAWPPPKILDDEGLVRWASVRPPTAARF